MIRREDVFSIGYIAKHRGLKGEVELFFTDDIFDTGHSPYLILDMDGILVPFFWEEYRFKNADTAIFKFEDIDTEQQARSLVGHAVCYPKAEVPQPEDDNTAPMLSSFKALTGYTVSDTEGGHLGKVVGVDDSSANVLLYIEDEHGQETIIPFHPDFLVQFDYPGRSLLLRLPEGLLNLNNPE